MIGKFQEFMASKGLACPGPIIPDSNIYRFHVEGDRPSTKNGWYVFFGNSNLPGGSFGSWKGEKFNWSAKKTSEMTASERATYQRQIAEAKAARDEELKKVHQEAREEALGIWEAAKRVDSHPYLTRKGIKGTYDLRVGKYYRSNNALIVPLSDIEGRLWTLEYILPDGTKRFLENGKKQGNFWRIDKREDGPLLVCEGVATGASLHETTGYSTLCAMDCGNLLPVCKILCENYPNREIIICADDDWDHHDNQGNPDNPGLRKAKAAAQAIGAKQAVPRFKDQTNRGTDFNDLQQIEGQEVVRLQIEEALRTEVTQEGMQGTIDHLATLSPPMYDRQRTSMADKLGIRVTTLDAEVKKLREINNPDKSKELVETLELWPDTVSGAEILTAIYKKIKDFVVMPDEAAVAASLWTVLTYAYDAFRILPVLEIKSPEKRCGKTRLLEVLSGLAYRALPSSNLTPATVYRVIEKCNPCLLIDEADTFLPQNDELRGVLNSGHTRRTAFVTRCNSETNEPERFSTWCPKVIALIGKLPGTLDDRAIVVSLKRKLTTEQTQRLSLDFDDQCLELRQKCLKWANDSMAALRLADPDLPAIDNDRALDNWSPLIAIADLAGGDWPTNARNAMRTIEATKEDDSARVLLLKDIQKVFEKRQCDRLWTKNLIEGLIGIEGHPWGEWRKGRPLSAAGLARMLKPFEIKPGQLNSTNKNKRGYELKQFQEVFARYIPIPTPPPDQSAWVLEPADHAGYRRNQSAWLNKGQALRNGLKPAPIANPSTQALTKGGLGEEDPNLEDHGAGCSDTDENLSLPVDLDQPGVANQAHLFCKPQGKKAEDSSQLGDEGTDQKEPQMEVLKF